MSSTVCHVVVDPFCGHGAILVIANAHCVYWKVRSGARPWLPSPTMAFEPDHDPARPTRRREKLDALRDALDGRAPEGYRDTDTVHALLVELTTELVPDDPFDPEALDDPRGALAWIRRRNTSWELREPAQPPSDDFAGLVLDGRPDLTDPDADVSSIAPELVGVDTRAWVAFGHGHDGHRFLFWDTSATKTLRVIHVDNSEPEVVTGCEETTEEFLVYRILPDLLGRPSVPSSALSASEAAGTIGCGLFALALVVAVTWWLIG